MQTLLDTLLIFRRHLGLSLRNPAWVVIGLTQPVLYLIFFGPLLVSALRARGSDVTEAEAWQVYVPGLLVQLSLFGSGFVGFGIIGEWRMGIIERMRVTPVSRLALLLGRVLRDMVVQLIQSALLIGVGTAFGLRAPVLGVLLGLGFVLLISMSLASLSYTAGLLIKSEDAFAPLLSAVSVPLMLLSGVLLPMALAPGWLNFVSRLTPFRYIVEAMRDVFRGDYATTGVLLGVVVAVALATASVAFGTRTFRREHV
jgi:ABC-2 type transport system permease protein